MRIFQKMIVAFTVVSVMVLVVAASNLVLIGTIQENSKALKDRTNAMVLAKELQIEMNEENSHAITHIAIMNDDMLMMQEMEEFNEATERFHEKLGTLRELMKEPSFGASEEELALLDNIERGHLELVDNITDDPLIDQNDMSMGLFHEHHLTLRLQGWHQENESLRDDRANEIKVHRNLIRNAYVWNDSYYDVFRTSYDFNVSHPDYPARTNVTGEFLFERVTYYEKEYIWQYGESEAQLNASDPSYRKHEGYWLHAIDDFIGFVNHTNQLGMLSSNDRDYIVEQWISGYRNKGENLVEAIMSLGPLETLLAEQNMHNLEQLHEIVHHFSEVMDENITGFVGDLETSMDDSLDEIDASFNYSIMASIFIGAIAIAAAVVIGIYVSRMITRPLVYMRDVAERVSKGELDAEIDVATNDEIGELGRALNRMLNSVKMAIQMLDKQ